MACAEKIGTVREAAAAAGRDPDTIALLVSSRRPEPSQKRITPFLASVGAMGLKAPHMRARVPAQLPDAIAELEERYDPRQHVVVGGTAAKLVEELGQVDFLVDLRGVTGTPDQVRLYTDETEKLGVSCIFAALPGSRTRIARSGGWRRS